MLIGGIVHYNKQLAKTVIVAAWLPADSYLGKEQTHGDSEAKHMQYYHFIIKYGTCATPFEKY